MIDEALNISATARRLVPLYVGSPVFPIENHAVAFSVQHPAESPGRVSTHKWQKIWMVQLNRCIWFCHQPTIVYKIHPRVVRLSGLLSHNMFFASIGIVCSCWYYMFGLVCPVFHSVQLSCFNGVVPQVVRSRAWPRGPAPNSDISTISVDPTLNHYQLLK